MNTALWLWFRLSVITGGLSCKFRVTCRLILIRKSENHILECNVRSSCPDMNPNGWRQGFGNSLPVHQPRLTIKQANHGKQKRNKEQCLVLSVLKCGVQLSEQFD